MAPDKFISTLSSLKPCFCQRLKKSLQQWEYLVDGKQDGVSPAASSSSDHKIHFFSVFMSNKRAQPLLTQSNRLEYVPLEVQSFY